MPAWIAASILSADLTHLADQVKAVESLADVIYIDCMDALFVPVPSVGPVVVDALRPHTRPPLHCHQVEQPPGLLEDRGNAGADIVSAHVEAVAGAGHPGTATGK